MTDVNIRRIKGAQVDGLVVQGNEIVDTLRGLGLIQHIGLSDQITTPDASDLPTVQTLANALKASLNAHVADTTVHDAADATNTVTSAAATDQGTSNTLLNEVKTDFNAHMVLSAPHGGKVAGEARVTIVTVSTTNAIDLSTSIALANALKAALNRHYISGARRINYTAP